MNNVGTASRQRKCTKCATELVNARGIHMGIPFGHWHYKGDSPMLVCIKCYDALTVDENKIQRTGEETV
jgi:hypothetical protein